MKTEPQEKTINHINDDQLKKNYRIKSENIPGHHFLSGCERKVKKNKRKKKKKWTNRKPETELQKECIPIFGIKMSIFEIYPFF